METKRICMWPRRAVKLAAATKRQAAYSNLSLEGRLKKLDDGGYAAVRERAKIGKQIERAAK